MSKTPAARAAEEIIEKLEGRGGFDHWWGGVARTDQREIVDTLTGIIDAASTARPRPKLEIVRTEDGVDIWLGGKIVSQHVGHLAKLEAVEETARDIAAALGADVERTDDPAPQPYTYFIAYRWMNGSDHGPGQVWHFRSTPIEGVDSLEESRLKIKRDNPKLGEIVIANFILVDGPS